MEATQSCTPLPGDFWMDSLAVQQHAADWYIVYYDQLQIEAPPIRPVRLPVAAMTRPAVRHRGRSSWAAMIW